MYLYRVSQFHRLALLESIPFPAKSSAHASTSILEGRTVYKALRAVEPPSIYNGRGQAVRSLPLELSDNVKLSPPFLEVEKSFDSIVLIAAPS